ncbi:MAG: hypothetical protein ACJAWN_002500, partial [Neolewinella sp.]
MFSGHRSILCGGLFYECGNKSVGPQIGELLNRY